MKLKYWATEGNTSDRMASVPDGIRREVRTVSSWAVFIFCPSLREPLLGTQQKLVSCLCRNCELRHIVDSVNRKPSDF